MKQIFWSVFCMYFLMKRTSTRFVKLFVLMMPQNETPILSSLRFNFQKQKKNTGFDILKQITTPIHPGLFLYSYFASTLFFVSTLLHKQNLSNITCFNSQYINVFRLIVVGDHNNDVILSNDPKTLRAELTQARRAAEKIRYMLP